jgi:hypothetical protein
MELWRVDHERMRGHKEKSKIKHAVLHRHADMIDQPAKPHTS